MIGRAVDRIAFGVANRMTDRKIARKVESVSNRVVDRIVSIGCFYRMDRGVHRMLKE